MLSLYLQSRTANAVSALHCIDSVSEKLLVLKNTDGKTLSKFVVSYDRDGSYKGIALSRNDADCEKFRTFRYQFIQALIDNLCARFPCTDILAAARVLDNASWPKDSLERVLVGHFHIYFD
jgi:hypothetical protein